MLVNIEVTIGPVLMVDDSDVDAYLARYCYDRAGIANRFVHLPSGEDLLAYLDGVTAGHQPMPAVVLLDINMPGLGGFETLEQVRGLPQFRDVPVIAMLTNSDDPEEAARSEQLGADGFFTKPSTTETYIELFQRIVPDAAG